MKMMMMMMMAIMFASSVVVPLSWAQEVAPCWTPIADCVSHVDMHHKKNYEEFQYFLEDECCTVMNKESRDDIVCFCSVTPSIQRNDSILESFNAFLSLCHMDSSFTTYCQGVDVAAPPSTPIGLPSPPSSSPSNDSIIIFIYNIFFRRQNQPKRRGPKLDVLIPSVVVPGVTVIAAAVQIYFYIKRLGKVNDEEKGKENNDLKIKSEEAGVETGAGAEQPHKKLLG